MPSPVEEGSYLSENRWRRIDVWNDDALEFLLSSHVQGSLIYDHPPDTNDPNVQFSDPAWGLRSSRGRVVSSGFNPLSRPTDCASLDREFYMPVPRDINVHFWRTTRPRHDKFSSDDTRRTLGVVRSIIANSRAQISNAFRASRHLPITDSMEDYEEYSNNDGSVGVNEDDLKLAPILHQKDQTQTHRAQDILPQQPNVDLPGFSAPHSSFQSQAVQEVGNLLLR